MSEDPSDGEPLADRHNVTRYCGKQAISEFSGRPTSAAFKIRDGEDYLSVNWLECFHESDFAVALMGVRCALTRKGRMIGSSSCFATLNVGNVKNTIFQKLRYGPQIVRKVEQFDESHAGIYVRRSTAMIAAHELALACHADMHSGKGYEECPCGGDK